MFMTLKSCNKVFRGGHIQIILTKDNIIYTAFNIDRTPIPGVVNTAIQIYPTSQAAAGTWNQYYNNVSSPWVDLSNAAPMPFKSIWNDATLYLRNVQPKYTIYAKIMEKYVPEHKPVFYNAITTAGAYTALTTSQQQTVLLGTPVANADYLIFAFQINPGGTPRHL
jgi:hypothetical protein